MFNISNTTRFHMKEPRGDLIHLIHYNKVPWVENNSLDWISIFCESTKIICSIFCLMLDFRRLYIKLEEVKSEVRENRKLLQSLVNKLDSRAEEQEKSLLPEDLPALPLEDSNAVLHLNEVLAANPEKKKQLVSVMLSFKINEDSNTQIQGNPIISMWTGLLLICSH